VRRRGGLEALRVLVKHLPRDSGSSFVIAQHLSPSHRSMLVELLGRETELPVLEAKHELVPAPDTIYVTPSSCHIRFDHGRIALIPISTPGTPKPSVDNFFTSLAEAFGESSVGVILSGTGSDGARGSMAIHAAGGHTIAQDPASAKYEGMPRAAIDIGSVDYVLPVESIGPHLATLLRRKRDVALKEPATEETALESIFRSVRTRTGLDLALYKPGSLQRRLRRRLVATDCRDLDQYAQLLRSSPDEAQNMKREMLISVTGFFRDVDPFEELDGEIARILDDKPEGEELRIWVPGCASGEEAYTIAMLVCESTWKRELERPVRLFATDLDSHALARARKGVYDAETLAAIPEHLRARYFSLGELTGRVSKRIRDMVVFSEHDLTRDPPFLRMDVISCRNVLIYLKPAIQQRLLETFSYALVRGGVLLLGKAEGVQGTEGLYLPAGPRGRVFRRLDTAGPTAPASLPRVAIADRLVVKNSTEPPDIQTRLLKSLSDGLLPPSVVVDEALAVRHVLGDVSPFLRMTAGSASLDLLRLAVRPIRVELRGLMFQVQKPPLTWDPKHVELSFAGGRLGLLARRLAGQDSPPLWILSFLLDEAREATPPTSGEEQAVAQIEALEEQLSSTREHLHTVVEELETSNEELQSLNEEMQSANEELQSANEELETSNEELQSTNQELLTVNEELEARSAELAERNADLRNVKESLVDGLIVVDEHRRVVLFNPPATRIFALDEDSLGTHLFSLPSYIEVGDLSADVGRVMAIGVVAERQIDGETRYAVRVQPYRDGSGGCKGAVLTFTDNTSMKRAEDELRSYTERLRASEEFRAATLDALAEQICVIDTSGVIVSTNRSWSESLTLAGGTGKEAGCGVNYLAVCRSAAARGDDSAARFLAGLLDVLEGRAERFRNEYACARPGGVHTYEVTVTAFQGAADRHVVVRHLDVTHQKEQAVLMKLQSAALDSSSNRVCIADALSDDLPMVYINRAFERITGYTEAEVIGRNLRFLHTADHDQAGLSKLRIALKERASIQVLLRNYRKDGRLFWNELSISPLRDQEGIVTHLVGIQRDVTELVESEEALRASLSREHMALTLAGIGSLDWDIRTSTMSLSEQHVRQLGLPEGQTEIPYMQFRRLLAPEDGPVFDDAVKICLSGHAPLDVEYRIVMPDGAQRWLHTRGNAVMDEGGVARRILALSQDITDRKNTEERVRFIAHHDALTGLPNRALLRDRMQHAIKVARRRRERLAVLFIDLDHFKRVNDSIGHEAGDQLLVSVAGRLLSNVRDTDSVCRQGGDEFLIVLPGVRDSNEAAHIAGKILTAVTKPHAILGQDVFLTCSIGVSLYPDDGDTIDALMRHADTAMYHAKGSGRNAIAFFSHAMNAEIERRTAVASRLRHALSGGELELHYQPEIDVSSGSLIGIEALIRWRHPERGLVYPDGFIPVAEESDLIHEIGEWVLRTACAQNREWQSRGLPKVPMAVNVSAAQLRQRNIIEKISAALHDSGLSPEFLELEITERAIIHDADQVGELLADLRDAGIRLALDDFGTGYSSLTYLQRFPVDKLKIDKSFVQKAPGDRNAMAIVRGVIYLAQGLQLKVIAEGVESRDQLDFLRGEHCWGFQGYLNGPALPVADFERMHLH
jgi:two-component system, chemotaxis family, CheB/CheR fusion protein